MSVRQVSDCSHKILMPSFATNFHLCAVFFGFKVVNSLKRGFYCNFLPFSVTQRVKYRAQVEILSKSRHQNLEFPFFGQGYLDLARKRNLRNLSPRVVGVPKKILKAVSASNPASCMILTPLLTRIRSFQVESSPNRAPEGQNGQNPPHKSYTKPVLMQKLPSKSLRGKSRGQ